MKPQSAKAKGRKLQQWIAKKATEIFRLEEGDIESRPMGSGGVDLMMSPAARRKFPFSIEAKNTKKFPSIGALRQSNVNIYSKTLAGVCWKPPGKGPEETIIYFNLEEFMEFWNEQNEEAKDNSLGY